MKIQSQKFAAVSLAATLTLSSMSALAGGSHDHKHAMEFDPVHNEFGMYEPDMEVTRTIEIDMSDDMAFSPSEISVKQGDVIKFVHKNTGQLMHEFVLGTPSTLDEHAEMMKKFPGMEHEEPYMAHVAPGEEGEVTWKFSQAGEFSFGCLIPGHYDSGMKGRIIVAN